MSLRFREHAPKELDYISAAPPENCKVIGNERVNHALQEGVFKNLQPLDGDTRRCVIALPERVEAPIIFILEDEKYAESRKVCLPENWEELMEYAASIIPEIEDICGYIGGEITPDDSNCWQFLALLYIGGVVKGHGENQEQAKVELMNALSGFYGIYKTDTLVLLRTRVTQPIWIYPWGEESKVTFH